MKNAETAKRLQRAMTLSGLSQQELSDRTGVSKASISQYVNGAHVPSNISAGKMAKVLHVSPVWLMGFDVPMIDEDEHYENNDTAKLAQEIFDNSELKALFDVQKDMSPEDLQALHHMALALKRKEKN